MRLKTVTERYQAVQEGKMAKREFVRQMRQEYPMHITQFNGFEDSVQILKNRGLLFEAKKDKKQKVEKKPALSYSLDSLDRGIRYELQTDGVEFQDAEKRAKANLEKDPLHYLNLVSGESSKVDKHDKMKETKRGAKDKDTYNDLKKATLKEEMAVFSSEEDEDKYIEKMVKRGLEKEKERAAKKKKGVKEAGPSGFGTGQGRSKTISKGREERPDLKAKQAAAVKKAPKYVMKNGVPHKFDANGNLVPLKKVSEETTLEDRLREALSDPAKLAATKAIKAKYPEVTAGILDSFFEMHGDDISNGADPLDEFTEFFYANFEVPSDYADVDEKKGKDHDGDGDIDGDDYMAAKDKAIKKAMGKDVEEAAIPEKNITLADALERYSLGEILDTAAEFYASEGEEDSAELSKQFARDFRDMLDKFDPNGSSAVNENKLKEAITSIIKKTLNENTINEAATNRLAAKLEDLKIYPGAQQVINQLENIVTEVESFYGKTRDKIQKVYDSMESIENEEGLKIGVFIGPGIESAFLQDLKPVTRKGFTQDLQLPKAKQLDPEMIAQARAAGDIDEAPEEDKQTVFTPINEALNKELKQFGPDVKKRLESLGFTTAIFNGSSLPNEQYKNIADNPKYVGIVYYRDENMPDAKLPYEQLSLYTSPKNLRKLEKVVDRYNVPSQAFGPEKDMGWVTKKAINVNDGDILRSEVGNFGGGLVGVRFYRFEQGNLKNVSTKDKTTGKTDMFKQAAE